MLKSMFHTGFVVKDLEKAIAFYTEVMGLRVIGRVERRGEFADQLVGFPNAHVRGALLEIGQGHQLELVQYLSPASGPGGIQRNDLGATHLAFFVENTDQFQSQYSGRGLLFLSPPASLYDEKGKLVRKAVFAQNPDVNWLEFVELF